MTDNYDRRPWASLPIFMLQLFRSLRENVGGNWTINQTLVMFHVALDDMLENPCTASRIAAAEGLSQQAVSSALHSLRKSGYITEVPFEEDLRVKYLRPTDKYQRVRQAVLLEMVGISDHKNV